MDSPTLFPTLWDQLFGNHCSEIIRFSYLALYNTGKARFMIYLWSALTNHTLGVSLICIFLLYWHIGQKCIMVVLGICILNIFSHWVKISFLSMGKSVTYLFKVANLIYSLQFVTAKFHLNTGEQGHFSPGAWNN